MSTVEVCLDDCPICAKVVHQAQQDEADQFLRGMVAGVALACLAVLIVTGLIVAGAR